MRSYCSQVFRQARLWDRIEKSVRASEFTFPGDPMRRDYSYRRNGTRGFVQSLSVTRAPADAKPLAYTAERIIAKASLKTEFAAVTDVALNAENDRHRFVRDTLRDAGIEPVAMEGFAVWVAKLKPLLQGLKEGNPETVGRLLGHGLEMFSSSLCLFTHGKHEQGGIVLPAAPAELGYHG
jgi:hypothetical protein